MFGIKTDVALQNPFIDHHRILNIKSLYTNLIMYLYITPQQPLRVRGINLSASLLLARSQRCRWRRRNVIWRAQQKSLTIRLHVQKKTREVVVFPVTIVVSIASATHWNNRCHCSAVFCKSRGKRESRQQLRKLINQASRTVGWETHNPFPGRGLYTAKTPS